MNWDGLSIKSRLSSLALSSHDAIPGADANSVEKVARAGERPVCHLQSRVRYVCTLKSRSLGVERKVGGKLHLKLKKCLRPIASKYYEGKMQRILKIKLTSAWNCWKGSELGSELDVLLGEIGAWRWHSCQCLRCCLPCLSKPVQFWIKLVAQVSLSHVFAVLFVTSLAHCDCASLFIIRFAMSLRCHRNAPTDTHSEAVRMSAVSIKLPLRLSPCRILSLHVSVVCRSPDGVRKRRRGPVRWKALARSSSPSCLWSYRRLGQVRQKTWHKTKVSVLRRTAKHVSKFWQPTGL